MPLTVRGIRANSVAPFTLSRNKSQSARYLSLWANQFSPKKHGLGDLAMAKVLFVDAKFVADVRNFFPTFFREFYRLVYGDGWFRVTRP